MFRVCTDILHFLQAITAYVGRPLAICAEVKDRSYAITRLNRTPPAPPLVPVFE